MSAQPELPQPAGDPLWYKDAVIYEVHVRAFFDSNDDGVGDFGGLTRKLDYIQDLGVNTIWLLPFYPSPGKDDGYDISDYHNIHAHYGTRGDFRMFVQEAHRRGLRVITELVINHTSDAHPWFQAARRAPAGSPKRDYYVWSDSPDRYAGTRVIFRDTETSNWALDPLAKTYYWHRFFSHQPDLNFDNPHVVRAVIHIMEYWLDQGVDGLRLDAIPYLVEREGTSNENLRETHELIKRIRAVINEHYADRMLLAEANQWPEDVRDYFGDGDECHMAYHFPLMPRMYMAIAQEDRHPIVEIMEQTPDIPDTCQWAIFLRNHDELTLEMVTSRERDYMYRMYAADPRARLNLGIRRRLAPLMENDPERIKLMNSLLLSMPGAPIIYYGDEIGMGDNFFLGDRNGVRTPMQWSPDRNAGFSRADPQQLYLPPIMDPIYGYEAVNVEAQTRDRSSLLNWMKRMLQVRKTSQAFGRGTLRFIRPGNRKVLVYLREYGPDSILCVVNLARSAQPVEVDLADFKGTVPIELIGRTPFPPVGDLPYLLTLPGYGFYWFQLSRDQQPPSWHDERLPREDLPVLVLFDGWTSFFPERVANWRSGLATKLREQLETRVAPKYIASQRWYAGKGAPIVRARLGDNGEWDTPLGRWLAGVFEVESSAGKALYFLPFAIAYEDTEESRWQKLQPGAIARVRRQATVGVLADATTDENFCRAVVEAIGQGARIRTERGEVHLSATAVYSQLAGDQSAPLSVTPTAGQSSNTTVRVGDQFFLKIYRRLQAGINPELEIGRYLTEVVRFPSIVPVAGAAEYRNADGNTVTLALLQAFVTNQGDGWDYTVNYLSRFLEERRTEVALREDVHGVYLELMKTLATRTAELHRALAAPTSDPAFAPEPLRAEDIATWRLNARREAEATLEQLAKPPLPIPQTLLPDVEAVLARRAALLKRIDSLGSVAPQGLKIRPHGDYHLGQVLVKRNDFIIVDFEGEPGRSLAERRLKQSPLRDVAGMLRSFSYARHAAVLRGMLHTPDDVGRWEPMLEKWESETRRVFLTTYDAIASAAGLYRSLPEVRPLLELFELEKALYEARYELGNRPDWASIPLRSLLAFTG
ncbi:MAG TPA: maltose alpha-D-glucosyltransferase [Steroidobacteraceae bacterium]|nr:maltose alpha-D-glucosyltransferase [Steroidobacteraceae bacterium]